MRVHLDYETRCDLDITKVGLRQYVNHPSFEIILISWSHPEEGPVTRLRSSVYLLEKGSDWSPFVDLLKDPEIHWHAFNAAFEREATFKQFGIWVPHERWHCTMAHAYGRGFSGGLAQVGSQIGLPADKQKLRDGKLLINRFCSPPYVEPKDDPERWARFKEYNMQDVIAERKVYRFLSRMPETPRERAIWVLDQEINARGVPVDMDLVDNALRLEKQVQDQAVAEMKKITGLANPMSQPQLLAWVRKQGLKIDDLQRATLEKVLEND